MPTACSDVEGTTDTDVMLEAMERIVVDGADVLNMSIGSSYQWPQYPTSRAADRLVKQGIVVVASIGNSGATGLYSASAPGVGRDVIGVASFDNTHENLPAISISPDDRLAGYRIGVGVPLPPATGTFPLARTGTTTSTADACNGATAPAPGSLTGRYALIRRGTCGFYEKAFNAQTAGAIGVVLYNNVAGRLNFNVAGTPPVTIPVIMVNAADGSIIDARIASGPTTMTFSTALVAELLPTGNLISSFSSYGVAPDLSLKPDLGAPGGNIRSTIPLEQGAYGPNSGTSMASPHVAGAVALLLEARPDIGARKVLGLLQNTAKPHLWFGNPALGFLDNVHRQGGGMLDVVGAIRASALTIPSSLALGEIESGPVTRQVTLQQRFSSFAVNSLPKGTPVQYTLGHEPALSTGANTFVPSFLSSFASVTFSTPTVAFLGKAYVRRDDHAAGQCQRPALRRLHHADAQQRRRSDPRAVLRLQRGLSGDSGSGADRQQLPVAGAAVGDDVHQSADRRNVHDAGRGPAVPAVPLRSCGGSTVAGTDRRVERQKGRRRGEGALSRAQQRPGDLLLSSLGRDSRRQDSAERDLPASAQRVEGARRQGQSRAQRSVDVAGHHHHAADDDPMS